MQGRKDGYRQVYVDAIVIVEHDGRYQLLAFGYDYSDERESDRHAERVLDGTPGAVIVLGNRLHHVTMLPTS